MMILNTPITVRNVVIGSRLVMPPMATKKSQNGIVDRDIIAYYTRFAANPRIGLIITEHSYIDPRGKADPRQISFASDNVIPAQIELTKALHAVRSELVVMAQISHAGRKTTEQIAGGTLVSASESISNDATVKALSQEQIHELSHRFADAAQRVRQAGYDGVELHCAHGYLLNQFYSPLTNFRTDCYGPQSLQNRLRFLVETVQLTRRKVGDDFPIAVRLGGADYQKGGSTIEDAVQAATILENIGIDLLDISGGLCAYIRPDYQEPGYFGDVSAPIKKTIRIPVVLTGGVNSPLQAETLLHEEKADLVGVGRALLHNPMWGEL